MEKYKLYIKIFKYIYTKRKQYHKKYEIKHIFHTKCYNISYISQANSLPHKAFEKLLIKAELSKDMILSYLLF